MQPGEFILELLMGDILDSALQTENALEIEKKNKSASPLPICLCYFQAKFN